MLYRNPTPQIVQLSSGQLSSCMAAAIAREQDSLNRGYQDARGYTRRDSYMEDQAKSFAAELSFSTYLGINPQTGINNVGGVPDITFKNRCVDVKTPLDFGGGFNVSPKHLHDDWFYVFVDGKYETGEFSIHGYIKGKDIPSKGTLSNCNQPNRPPIWTIPKYNLTPFKDITHYDE